jgi:hypothetical protein
VNKKEYTPNDFNIWWDLNLDTMSRSNIIYDMTRKQAMEMAWLAAKNGVDYVRDL